MTLNDLNEEINYFTERLAAETTKLDYAGIAIIWMFKPDRCPFPVILLLSGGMLIASLLLYLLFLFYSWRRLDRTFDEKEAEIDRLDLPETEKSVYDFGGWDSRIVIWKNRLRYAYLCCCLSGYLLLGVYAVKSVF